MEYEKVVKIDGKHYALENKRPENGDYWTYIAPKDWVEPPVPAIEEANWPEGWMEKCWDRANYWKVTGATDESLGLPLSEECETCDGKGEGFWACCSGDKIDGDFPMCPSCKEWLGEEDCGNCGGTGYVPKGTPNEPVHVVDLIGQAEAYAEAQREGL